MAKEKPEIFDSVAWEAQARKERAEFEAVERVKDEAFQQMVQFARSVGCVGIENPAMCFLEFRTWQEALDFQVFCEEEKKFRVRIVEPPPKDNGIFKQWFRVYPVWE